MTDNLKTKRTRRRDSINGVRNILTVKGKDPDFHYRIVRDEGDRIQEFESMGYEVVRDSTVKVGDRRISNPTSDGSPVEVSLGGGNKGYLMRIPKEYAEEDSKNKMDNLSKLEAGMKREARDSADYGKVSIT